MTDLTTASPDALESLRVEMEARHAEYSSAFHLREDAEQALATHAARRATLIKETRKLQRSTETRMLAVITSAVDDPVKADPSEIVDARAKIGLLEAALKHFGAFAFADAERAVLAATVEEKVLQLRFEQLRLEHQDQSVVLALCDLQSSAGELQTIGLGERSEAMGRVVHQVASELAEAREQLRRHESATNEARELFLKEHTWTHAKP